MDREKVINHFEDALSKIKPVDWWVSVRKDFLSDALVLLKEQKAVPRHHKCIGETYALINEEGTKFCPWCGRKVNWND